MKLTKLSVLLIAFVFWAIEAYAIEAIPKKSGFSGFFSCGGGVINVESNMMTGNRLIDFGDEIINSLGSPDSESKIVPAVNFELKYTFADTRTQVFLGNLLEDLLTFDMTSQAGFRRDMKNYGIMAGSFVFNSIPTEVWADPYVTNIIRQKTDRTSTGLRFTWDRIFRTQFQWQSTYRNIELDNERSGVFLELTPTEMALLNREGRIIKNEISYRFRIDKGRFVVPSANYIRNDRDGGAMDSDNFHIQLTYFHATGRCNFILNGMWGLADYDQRNPIFNKTREDDLFGLGTSVFYLFPDYKPLGCTSFHLWGTAAYYKSDTNISFYDANVSNISAGCILYY